MKEESKKISVKFILMIILVAIIILFMVMNRESVTVHMLVGKMTMPLFVVIGVSALIGWLIGFLIPKVKKQNPK